MSSPPTAVSARVSARAITLDEARLLGTELYYPHRLTPLSEASELTMTALAARLGTVTVGVLRYSAAIRIDTAPYVTALQVNVPLQGTLRTSVGAAHVRATHTRAALYPHDVPTAITGWETPCAMMAIKLDRALVEERYLSEYGRPLDVHATPVIDTSTGGAAAWITGMREVIATVQRLPQLDPGLARHLADRCIDGFVLSAYAGEESRERPAPSTGDARTVERAREAISQATGAPLSLGVLAGYVGVSARTLQAAFQRLAEETPMQAQRRERLERAHRDLASAAPGEDLVSAVALRHGFTHLGRFSSEYHRHYGEQPSQTLAR